MKSPRTSPATLRYAFVASLLWVASLHAVAFDLFGFEAIAGLALVVGLLCAAGATLGYLAWEYQRATLGPQEKEDEEAPTQDVSLLMISHSSREKRSLKRRHSRHRITGHHPVTDRVATLHQPPHAGRRDELHEPASVSPMLEFPCRTAAIESDGKVHS